MPADPIGDLVRRRMEFIARLPVETKRGQTRPMDDPTPGQATLAAILGRHELREIVLYKPRQVRFSQTNCAHVFQRFFASKEPLRTLIVTNHQATTRNLFKKFRTFYTGLPAAVQKWNPTQINLNDRTLTSSHDALIDHLTAGGKAHGRSWTYQHLVCEEMAFWPNADEVFAAVTQTVDDDAPIVYVSTANGPSGLFYEKVLAAREAMRRGDPGVLFHFERWIDHPEYRHAPPPGWEPDGDEAALAETYGLDLDQLYWRHQKIHGVRGIGIARFRHEFPITEDDGFVIVDGSWFDCDYLLAVKESLPAPVQGECRIYRPPERGMTYVAGIDPSWCNGGDDAVCCILDALGTQVAVLSMNEGGEELFGTRAAELCHAYNHARACYEANPGGAGKAVGDILRDNHVPLWKENQGEDGDAGFTTSHGSKVEAFAHARQMVNGDALELTDHTTIEQLMHIREIPRGESSKIEGARGHKDDHVSGLVLAEWNRRTVAPAYPVQPRALRRRYVTRRPPMAAVRSYLGGRGMGLR